MAFSLKSLFRTNGWDDRPFAFETSWFFPPLVFGIVRIVISVYSLVTILVIYGWSATHGQTSNIARWFSYFTNLSFVGVAAYFLVAGIHSFCYAARGRSVLFEKWPRFLRSLHSLLYTTVTVFPLLVLIVYWAILYRGTWFPVVFNAWTNVSQHILPAFFALFEIIFANALLRPLIHLLYIILILVLYIALAYITHADQGFYTYSFLDPGRNGRQTRRVAAYIFAIAGATIALYGVVNLMIWIRLRYTRERTKLSRVASQPEGELNHAEMGMVERTK
ncbi:hypothetical protein D8B26_008114 [Coccidioides posadasii str. Silveira]|uniref:Uncharacterized protein n=2 Tax=Coccidioides posadasii TaxID=199306 RepID=E9DDX0_COCPS|nr:hypothetical protein CPC735_070860 [Coccidioides posadasii C735 delta SOWgp]EER29404.1 hypothetical protein CPC735_070860 [Coccidioides posadasii C735 delta SOWgp]EFW15324.1 conserved hypothetical protein [Coccidioides posadasii str. Silveira]QVM13506.1 hypothetical protein D8B26_008114 [Coccidioides posadasii str. Silveira]|eukprot:XP_003071549.1 hypothetical protein CPC735_070860 [Coccidioides posadasii C735 delta SOWgp]